MITITPEITKWYCHYQGETIALALRDMTAEVLRLEAYTIDADWQQAAHEMLMGETK